MLAVSGQLDRTPGSNESGEYLISKAETPEALVRPNRVTADDPYLYAKPLPNAASICPSCGNLLPDVLTLCSMVGRIPTA